MPNPRLLATALTIAAISACCDAWAENIDPANDGSQFAYAENLGWLNAEPLGNGGQGIEVEDLQVTGWLWSENAGWISLSCSNTSCAAGVWGVANDLTGRLSGFAWSENLGWINFKPNGVPVTIDRPTGLITGRAWSENAGWITFSASAPVAYGVKTSWCLPAPAVPNRPDLQLSKLGATMQLSWVGVASAYFDAIEGDLDLLLSSAGDYTSATTACVADNITSTSVDVPNVPAAGQGLWYLVRSANCAGSLGYDEESASQIGSREAEIDLSPVSCP